MWESLNLTEEHDYTAHVKGSVFKGRWYVTAGLRFRIPNLYKNLFFVSFTTVGLRTLHSGLRTGFPVLVSRTTRGVGMFCRLIHLVIIWVKGIVRDV